MESSRRNQAKQELGLDHSKEEAKINNAIIKEERRRLKKEEKRQELLETPDYKIMSWTAKIMDNYFLDPIIGFIPYVGDLITSIASLPYITFCLFRVKSIPLTLAVLNNTLIDALLGMIPAWIGNIIDFFYRVHKKNLSLIVNYINDDEDTISEVNSKALHMVIVLIILVVLIILMVKLVKLIIGWVSGWFA